MTGNPQVENGYTRIANEIMEALAKYRIPGEQMQCLMCILRKTYGWGKKQDAISISQFEKYTNLPRKNVCRSLSELQRKNVISGKKATSNTTIYWINKRYNEWKREIIKRGSGKKATKVVAKKPLEAVAKKPPTKEKKETITKEKKSTASADTIKKTNDLANYLYERKRWPKVHAFVNKMRKAGKNESSICHSLNRVKVTPRITGDACWGFAAYIVGVENGNYNEADYVANIQKQQRELEQWMSQQKT